MAGQRISRAMTTLITVALWLIPTKDRGREAYYCAPSHKTEQALF